MEVMHERVAGLDVHKEIIVACVRGQENGKARRDCQTFNTTTAGLLELLAWLSAAGCTHVAMEATGIYWKPVWAILSDGDFELILANAAHIKNVPGRKTDINDAMWIADLLACCLIRSSFVPEARIEELRTLLRTRTQLVREQTRHTQRIQKTLETANIKLTSVVTDIMGVSGRRMIEAMIAGVRNPTRLAELADRRLKASRKDLYDALHGRLTDHHRFLLRLHLQQYDALLQALAQIDIECDAVILRMDQEVAQGQATFRSLMTLLSTIPGVSQHAAAVILSEIGTDMGRFPSAGHVVAWAGLCPGQNESAGKRRATRLRKGAPWLKTTLVQCAWAATRKKDSYYKAQFNRLRARSGGKQAVCAVAASLLTAIYHMVKKRVIHHDLGADHFDRRPSEIKAKRLVATLNKLGYEVEIKPLNVAA
jgi:transposase